MVTTKPKLNPLIVHVVVLARKFSFWDLIFPLWVKRWLIRSYVLTFSKLSVGYPVVHSCWIVVYRWLMDQIAAGHVIQRKQKLSKVIWVFQAKIQYICWFPFSQWEVLMLFFVINDDWISLSFGLDNTSNVNIWPRAIGNCNGHFGDFLPFCSHNY